MRISYSELSQLHKLGLERIPGIWERYIVRSHKGEFVLANNKTQFVLMFGDLGHRWGFPTVGSALNELGTQISRGEIVFRPAWDGWDVTGLKDPVAQQMAIAAGQGDTVALAMLFDWLTDNQ